MGTVNNPTVIPALATNPCVVITQNWFLESGEKLGEGIRSQKVPATFKALVNGKEAFGELYEQIDRATSSIDIAIWGFQPSMYFKRDGNSLCIGDLLIRKALEGVKVRILVWSMAGDVQTFSEPNLGNKPGAARGRVDRGVTQWQRDYDRW